MSDMIRQRVETVQKELPADAALLLTGEANRFYFTGYPATDGFVVITREKAVLLTDFRYIEKAKATVTACEVQLSAKGWQDVAAFCAAQGVRTLYVETETLSIRDLGKLREAMGDIAVSEDDRFDRTVAEMRSVKAPEEIDRICAAQKMTDETFAYILDRIEPGRTEREIMLDMEFYMRRLGSEGVSFDFIVVSGKNSSLPHGVPTDKAVEKGDFVTMDFGAVVDGYRSDMTRTVAVGHADAAQKRVYDTVLKAQLAAIDAVRPGAVCRDIDRIARDIINAAGFEGCFGHGLGHSVGIEIHESPCFNTRCETVLRPGTVMTVEPGIYLENRYGVRIEDMVVTTADGCRDLTESPKDLIIL